MKRICAMSLLVMAVFGVTGAVAQANILVGGGYGLGENDPGAANGLAGDNPTINIGVTPGTDLGKVVASGAGPTYTSDVAASAAYSVGSTLAMNFGGTGYYLVGATPCDNLTHQAIEGWFKVSNLNQQAFAYNGNSYSDGLGLYLINGHVQAIAAGGFGLLDSGFAPTPGQWFYAATSVNGGTAAVYINSTTAAATMATGPLVSPSQFVIGAAGNSTDGFSDLLTGAADHVRVLAYDGVNFVFNPSTDLSYSGVPEPSTLALLVTGLMGLLAYAWRKRK